MTRPGLLVLLLLAACGGRSESRIAPAPAEAPAQPAPADLALSPLGREAYERLLTAERFTDGAIYDGGVTPNEVRALRVLWEEPEGARAFERLLDEATLGGRLFALCGVYYTDRALFGERIEPYRRSTETVFFQTGCSGLRDYPVAELVENPRPGAVRLAEGETVKEWLARRDNPNGTQGGYWLDILGGAYPNDFREGGGWHEVELEPFSPYAD